MPKSSAVARRYYAKVVEVCPRCVLCRTYGVQVSHSNELRGLSQKAPWYDVAALCPQCHYAIDNGGTMSSHERLMLHYKAIVLTRDAMIEAGAWRFVP